MFTDADERLLATKLVIPPKQPNLIARPRLTDRLNPTETQRLLLVVAPAGWGKTSLVRQWITQRPDGNDSIAWVSLDAADNDLIRFLRYLTAAFGIACPGLGAAAHGLLLSPQPPPTDLILTMLLNEISALNRSMSLVLDDYHLLEASAIHAAVTFLLDHLPPSLHLVIATRTDPPLPLSRLRVRNQLLEIRSHDLRFTHEEASAFLSESMGLQLDAEATALLEARTEGWIAGLQLAALSLQGQDNPSQYAAAISGSHRFIADFLFDEVLAGQPPDVAEFLIETSILERLSGPLCDALLGRQGSQELLEALESRNLFVIPLDADRRWFRYHHLFADALRDRLARQKEDRIAKLHGRASAWFAGAGMADSAILHALQGKHWESAVRLIEQYSDAIWIQGGQRELEQWLTALPADWIARRPLLTSIQAALYLYDLRVPEALSALDSCRLDAEDDSWTPDIRGRMAVLRSHSVRFRGDFHSSAAFAREALASLSQDNSFWRGSALFSLGVALLDGDQLGAAAQSLAEAIAESRKIGNTHTCVLATVAYGQLLYAQGALHEAADLYRSMIAFAEERQYHHAGEMIVLFAGLGRLHYQWNDLTTAEHCLHEGLKRKHPVYPVSCHLVLFRVRQAQNDRAGVFALLRHLEATATRTSFSWLPSAVTALQIRVKSLDEEATADWLMSYENRPPGQWPAGTPQDLREIEDLTWAQLRLGGGRTDLVCARFESLLETLTRQGRHGGAMEYRVLLATVYCRRSLMDRAVAVLEPALALGAQEGYTRVFLDADETLLAVLRECVARGIETEYAACLLSSFQTSVKVPGDRKPDAGLPSTRLSARELEVLRLVGAGLSNPEIAEHLILSVGTVKRHVHNIFLKLDATNRVNAVAHARQQHLL
ncbi:MAG: ATP-dependent transcriptional regulator [Chthonomonadales bacterium]|nr:ATP-dependent transcriptional regulator [Chthonomonadales bacterium]